MIRVDHGVSFTKTTLEREIRKADLELARGSGKSIDANTSRAELEAWRDRCAAVLAAHTAPPDDGKAETLRQARAWDSRKHYYLGKGMSEAEAARLAWES